MVNALRSGPVFCAFVYAELPEESGSEEVPIIIFSGSGVSATRYFFAQKGSLG